MAVGQDGAIRSSAIVAGQPWSSAAPSVRNGTCNSVSGSQHGVLHRAREYAVPEAVPSSMLGQEQSARQRSHGVPTRSGRLPSAVTCQL